MIATFTILALLTLASAVAAMVLRNLVHCALSLTVTFAGLAALYLQLGAQFVGFAQLLVYVGAVAILIVFAILLTRGSEVPAQGVFSSSWIAGVTVGLAVFAVLGGIILSSRVVTSDRPPAPAAAVSQIGNQLMTKYILPLEVLGLLLTVALLGAVMVAMHEKEPK
jgi:NADH-quinone oxidoreductase subunit J